MSRLSPYTCILAPNASILTGPGTTTVIVGGGVEGATVIDPAVDDHDYLSAVLKAGEERGRIRRILITHGHPDHMGGALALRRELGIFIYAFSRQGVPIADEEVPDGLLFPAGLRAIHTPGHRFDHLCFYLEQTQTLFAGDLLAGEGTVVIAPPEGDMQSYLDSLARLQQLPLQEIVPAHGPIITQPQQKIADYIAHRLQREEQILSALSTTDQAISTSALVQQMYADLHPALHPAAEQSVTAHLIKLARERRALQQPDQTWIRWEEHN
ncbi:MBL fold metallo-hydrolase [Tengunoibacter tsumagoiensis]|uniref:MBL fold metallo-hydrolase n=1 Tax=Tengunoibacter tsumagoiensis TaxID=2014871 RepID=A0A401ZTR9_9CHLR|nr:MBL fold metallo-hydrolase [Tengunoibacter tsumagoiensis]GCE10164.1 MBL fold metallo-hydrolase [Tengunoibacter tsumagoiensis]